MNRRIAIITGIIAIVLIRFGGKIYMDNNAEKQVKEEQRNILAIDRDAVLALKNTFSDISFIKIEQIDGPNKMTSS